MLNINLDNIMFNNAANNSFIEVFRKELKNFLEKDVIRNKEEELSLTNSNFDDNKLITEYRDKMYVERINILNEYAKQTANNGEMFFIYDKNSKLENGYNLYSCRDGQSHTVVEVALESLPKEAEIGSVLRKYEKEFIVDNIATKEVTELLNKIKEELYKEQMQYLNSKRVEGHIYEVSEKSNDRAWIFDITENSDEAIEEIGIEEQVLQVVQEGDMLIYKEGKYKRY